MAAVDVDDHERPERGGLEGGGEGPEVCGLDALYEMIPDGAPPEGLRFDPMLPRVYELTLPSIDSRLNFISVGRRHTAFLRHVYGNCRDCAHASVLQEKMALFSAVITKLLDINGILERREPVE